MSYCINHLKKNDLSRRRKEAMMKQKLSWHPYLLAALYWLSPGRGLLARQKQITIARGNIYRPNRNSIPPTTLDVFAACMLLPNNVPFWWIAQVSRGPIKRHQYIPLLGGAHFNRLCGYDFENRNCAGATIATPLNDNIWVRNIMMFAQLFESNVSLRTTDSMLYIFFFS